MSYLYLVFITIFYSLFKILSVAYQLKCNVNYLYFCVQTFSCLGEVFLNFSIGLQIVTSGSDGVNGVLNRLVSIGQSSFQEMISEVKKEMKISMDFIK